MIKKKKELFDWGYKPLKMQKPFKPFEMRFNIDMDKHPKTGKPMWDNIDCNPLNPREQDVKETLGKVKGKVKEKIGKVVEKAKEEVAKAKEVAKAPLRPERLMTIVGRNEQGQWRLLAEYVRQEHLPTKMEELRRTNPDIVKMDAISSDVDWRKDIEIRTGMASREPFRKMLQPEPEEQFVRKKVKSLYEKRREPFFPRRVTRTIGVSAPSRPYTKGWFGAVQPPPKPVVRYPGMVQRMQMISGTPEQPVIQTVIQPPQPVIQTPVQQAPTPRTGLPIQPIQQKAKPWAPAPKTGLIIYRGMGKEKKWTPPFFDYRA